MGRPNAAVQMSTACELLIPTKTNVNGVEVRDYPATGSRFFASVKSYGGSERVSNDLLVVEDTVVLTTWFRPDIKPHCRVKVLPTGAVYEVINEPENWNMRSQYLVFKCRRVKGDG